MPKTFKKEGLEFAEGFQRINTIFTIHIILNTYTTLVHILKYQISAYPYWFYNYWFYFFSHWNLKITLMCLYLHLRRPKNGKYYRYSIKFIGKKLIWFYIILVCRLKSMANYKKKKYYRSDLRKILLTSLRKISRSQH